MKDLYSIGETAKIMGISVQTLRNYANLKLLNPQYVDPETGYRYFSFRQFHYIDRIKYLRKLGLPLADIEEIIANGQTEKLTIYLNKQKEHLEDEMSKLKDTYDDILWYINYYNYVNKVSLDNVPYLSQFKTRYVMCVDYYSDDTIESVETRLARLKNETDLKYRRQYGYIAEFNSFIHNKFLPQKYFIYLKEKPSMPLDWLVELPAGTYLCLRAKICTDDWDATLAREYFKSARAPAFIIANEYEDSLQEYHTCPYEIQILVNEEKEKA